MTTRMIVLLGLLVASFAILLDYFSLSYSSEHLAMFSHYLNYTALVSAALDLLHFRQKRGRREMFDRFRNRRQAGASAAT